MEEFFYQLFNLSLLLYGEADSVEVPYKGINNLISYNDKDEESEQNVTFSQSKNNQNFVIRRSNSD